MHRHSYSIGAILVAVLPCLCALGAEESGLAGEIRKLASASGLVGMRVGLRVESLGAGGAVLYEQNTDEQFKPASNQKILTTAAAMTLLPPDFTYRTVVGVRGNDLVIIGAGDPSIGDARMARAAKETITTVFHRWAEELKKRGVTEIAGDLVYDDYVFEHAFIAPSWKGQFNLQDWYTAPVGGLNFNDNCVDVLCKPTKAGEPAEVTLVPNTPFVQLQNTTKTASKGQPIVRVASTNPFTVAVSGSVSAASGPSGIPLAITDPGAFFASACRTSLAAQGITIKGENRRQRVRAESGEVPVDVQVVAVHERKLHDILWRVDKSSQNMFAEAVLKTVGAYAGRPERPGLGSYDTARAAVGRFLDQLDIPRDTYVIADGSGLSHSNRVTPHMIAAILRFMDAHPQRAEWFSNLAVPGEQEGTLRRRMQELKGKVLAKTGYINGVSALSGYVEGAGGRRYIFTVLCNDTGKGKGGHTAARQLEDSLCRLLATYGTQTARKAEPAAAKPKTPARPATAEKKSSGGSKGQ